MPDMGGTQPLGESTMKKPNKYTYLFVIQGRYGFGWEDLDASESYREIRANLKAYRMNEGGEYRIVKRRELNAVQA